MAFVRGLLKKKRGSDTSGTTAATATSGSDDEKTDAVTDPPKASRRSSRAKKKDMASTDTDERMRKLMEMRGGTSGAGDKSASVHIGAKAIGAGVHPKTRKSSKGGKKGERRHSAFPVGEKKSKRGIADRSTSTAAADPAGRGSGPTKLRFKIPYRLKGEQFFVYDFYEPIRLIGSGAYAVVCEAKDTRSGRRVAIKKNKGVFDHITDARRILREIKLLMHFDHQDIIELVDVCAPLPREYDSFNDVYIVMPRMETTLAKVIKSKQKLSEQHFQYFVYQMVRGCKYMHSAGVIHRDLKPENILINGRDCDLKITDFGLARGVSKEEVLEKPTEYVVTRWYRSPEVMCSAGFYDEKVDIWSLGCILAEMLLKRPLFPGQNYLDQLKIIFEVLGTPKDTEWIKTPEAKKWVLRLKAHDGKPLEKIFSGASKSCLSILRSMLILNPHDRPSSEDLLGHAWFKAVRRPSTEVDCPKFDLSFEFEKTIKTRFGVRHMMQTCLTDYEREAYYKEMEEKEAKATDAKEKSSGKRKTKSAEAEDIAEGEEEEEDDEEAVEVEVDVGEGDEDDDEDLKKETIVEDDEESDSDPF
jgi:mitogen-activated protein kinase 1/3